LSVIHSPKRASSRGPVGCKCNRLVAGWMRNLWVACGRIWAS
jgi:hypothetical protein